MNKLISNTIRWFAKHILGEVWHEGPEPVDVYRVDKHLKWKFGTRYQNNSGPWRYARAGEKLKKGTLVQPGLAGRVLGEAGNLSEEGMSEIIYGDVRAVTDLIYVPYPDHSPFGPKQRLKPQLPSPARSALGWPEVDVPERRYFWLREVPPGARFVKEEIV